MPVVRNPPFPCAVFDGAVREYVAVLVVRNEARKKTAGNLSKHTVQHDRNRAAIGLTGLNEFNELLVCHRVPLCGEM
jgi:hypothetical protein